jgi:hypothetical protein
MKNIKLFENFTSLGDFNNIKPGTFVKYIGKEYEVIDNDGTILELRDEDGTIINVNYNMFKQKGYLPNTKMNENYYKREIILTSRQNRDIIITLIGGRIDTIKNESGVNFPFEVGQSYNRSIEVWACNNGFKMDGKDPCPEEKIFGIRKKDIPKGHELRMLYPGKFRK